VHPSRSRHSCGDRGRPCIRVPFIRAFRYIAFLEATSFLALLVAAVIKRTDGGETGVEILGPIHGLLFIAYVVMALRLREEAGWSWKTTGWILLGAVLPFGGYVVDWWLLRGRRAPERA
jgi:integral membrane protein